MTEVADEFGDHAELVKHCVGVEHEGDDVRIGLEQTTQRIDG